MGVFEGLVKATEVLDNAIDKTSEITKSTTKYWGNKFSGGIKNSGENTIQKKKDLLSAAASESEINYPKLSGQEAQKIANQI